jgi:hypothetical protein
MDFFEDFHALSLQAPEERSPKALNGVDRATCGG